VREREQIGPSSKQDVAVAPSTSRSPCCSAAPLPWPKGSLHNSPPAFHPSSICPFLSSKSQSEPSPLTQTFFSSEITTCNSLFALILRLMNCLPCDGTHDRHGKQSSVQTIVLWTLLNSLRFLCADSCVLLIETAHSHAEEILSKLLEQRQGVLNAASCTLRQFNSFNQKYESTVHLKGPTHLRSRVKTQYIEEKIERNTEKERDINRKKTQRQTDRARGEDNILHGSSLDKEDEDKSFLDLHEPVNRLQEKHTRKYEKEERNEGINAQF